MYESDVENPQSTDLVDEQLDGIAGGIMDLLDDTDPDSSGVAEVKPPDPAAETEEGETEEEAEPEAKADEPEKYTIKWQGQEKEVTQDELIDLAQKGFDYTQKTQKLAEDRDRLAPYEGLAKKIQGDPILANQIASYLSGNTQPPKQEKPTFDDPVEQLKWETRQEVLAEVDKRLQATVTPMARQQALDRVRMQVQADPDYHAVQGKIIEWVQSEPQSIQKTLYLQLDQDPQAYMEKFNQFKKQMATKPPETTKPTPVKKETRAPVLESGGVSPPDGIENKARSERLAKQKAKALRSGDNFELANWLQESGALEHLY